MVREQAQRFEELEAFEASLHDTGADLQTLASFFDKGEIVVVRVPARLDVMGGIADYSGANVCQATLGHGAVLGIQRRDDGWLKVRTQEVKQRQFAIDFALSIDNFFEQGRLKSYEEMRAFFRKNTIITWAGYIIGAVFTLLKEKKIDRLRHGFNIALVSSVPMAVGIGSSATVEISAIFAFDQILGLRLNPITIAHLGQMTENRVVGAPCGLMDQIAVTCGEQGRLIHILCQPDQIVGMVDIPDGCGFAGINSMVKHSVAGPKYTDVRVGTFMGKKIISETLKKTGRGKGKAALDYLCNVTPEEFEKRCARLLPERITGEEFLKKYGPTDDAATEVHPGRTYAVRSRTAHPIYENRRVLRFIEALRKACEGGGTRWLKAAGEEMYGSHESYASNCDLSAPEVDRLVALAKELGPARGIYGAKITGGGSGGTVAVFGREESLSEAVEEIVRRYEDDTGLQADVFLGSSPGAVQFRSCRYRLEWRSR